MDQLACGTLVGEQAGSGGAHALGFERGHCPSKRGWQPCLSLARKQPRLNSGSWRRRKGKKAPGADNAFEKLPDELLLKVTIRQCQQ